MTKEELIAIESSMSPEEIIEVAKRMCPVMRRPKGTLWWIRRLKIHNQSCRFSPSYICKAEGLTPVATVTTYHKTGGYHGFIKPSVDEAIYQCPKDIIDKVVAFEFVVPECATLGEVYDSKLDRHVLQTTYYTGVLSPKVSKKVEW